MVIYSLRNPNEEKCCLQKKGTGVDKHQLTQGRPPNKGVDNKKIVIR